MHKIRNLSFISLYTKYQDEAIADIREMEKPFLAYVFSLKRKGSVGARNAFGLLKKGTGRVDLCGHVNFEGMKIDGLVKSRHPGESRGPG